MAEMLVSVKQVSEIIAEIADASQEQRNGIEQVNQAIVQMDQTTQQNSALVEEAAAAASAMKEQASELDQLVSTFRLDPSLTGGATAPRRAANVSQLPSKRPAPRVAPIMPPAALAKAANDWEEF
jgi:ABC-type transporter Mla subunit MlaD